MKLTVSTASHGNMTELPDIIGFHGITAETRADLETRFPDYYFFGFGTSEQRDGLQNPIAFRRSLLALHGFEQFWLSDLPPVPGSRFVTDQTDTPRCCTAAVLMLRDGYRPIRRQRVTIKVLFPLIGQNTAHRAGRSFDQTHVVLSFQQCRHFILLRRSAGGKVFAISAPTRGRTAPCGGLSPFVTVSYPFRPVDKLPSVW